MVVVDAAQVRNLKVKKTQKKGSKKPKKEKGPDNMRLSYSKSGTPFIDMNGTDRFIFSKSTADPVRGYKFICFKKRITNTVTISGAKAKRKRTADISEDVNFTLKIQNLKRDGKTGPPKGVIPSLTMTYLKRLFKKHLKGEYLPHTSIPEIEKEINGETETDQWDDDPTATKSYDNVEEVTKVKPKNTTFRKKIKTKVKFNGISRKK